ncbi:H-NS histone family protein [Aeromonas hydrophila]|nr:H-NS family nucleoid-associated regulatory protein [Aeromonas hydrophila]QWL80165.1 H-NS histone family protein [Aeromonas hydrophila]
MLRQAGVDPDDLVRGSTHSVSANAGNKVKRASRPPKYKYQENGQEKIWTDQGCMLKAIAEQVAQGKSLE